MKVFVSGIAGFLGSHIAEAMLLAGHEVSGIDSLIGGDRSNVPSGAVPHVLDCTEREQVAELLRGIDVVYHCAATPHEGLSVFSPYTITHNVFDATASMLSASVTAGIKRFINMSSMSRYGSQEYPFREDMTPRPQDPYAIAKVAAEELVKNVCDTHGIEWVIAVPHNIIGPRQKYDDPFRNVAAIMINRVLQAKAPIIYGDGKQRRCFSYIRDVVKVLVRLADAPCAGQTFNIGPDEEFVTIKELAWLIIELTRYEGSPTYMPDRPREVRHATCSADKIREYFDYRTEWGLRQGLQAMIADIAERGPKPFSYYLDVEIVNEQTPRTWSEKLM